MTDMMEQLYHGYCREALAAPPPFTVYPPLKEPYQALSKADRKRVLAAMDEYEWAWAQYSRACFEQGIRFGATLHERLYPRDMA